MKKIILTIISVVLLANASVLRAENIGVPAECEDVMLQAFYWDSYTLNKYGRTKWLDLLKDTAAINANFDLVWFPPSASSKGGVGYIHACLSNQDNTAWGTLAKLKELIAALHQGKTRVLADIVINHRGNKSSWCDFYKDEFGQFGSYQLTSEHICKNDEVNSDTGAGGCKGAATGANDTGTNFVGARDLDHKNEYVRNWSKAYLKWMLKTMDYNGFRFDMTRGYGGGYLSMYIEAADPYFSVSEYWDGITSTVNHLRSTNFNTTIFDFPLKFKLGSALKGGYYTQLVNPSESLRGKGYAKYAVTFIDNHDTFERSDNQNDEFLGYNVDLKDATNKNKILQANAYILMLPGVPCVFWPHWKSYLNEINALIAIRKQAGIHSESAVLSETASSGVYEAKVQGHRGAVILRLGPNRSTEVPEGYSLALEGGDVADYTIFYKEGAQGIGEIVGDGLQVTGEKFVEDGKLFIRVNDEVYDVLGNKIR